MNYIIKGNNDQGLWGEKEVEFIIFPYLLM